MKKTTTVPIALLIAIAFGYIAFADQNTFTSLFAMFLAMASFAVALGLIWEKEPKKEKQLFGIDHSDMADAMAYTMISMKTKEPTFSQKVKYEEKRIRKVRSDKGVKRK